jgi:hypothetical protein
LTVVYKLDKFGRLFLDKFDRREIRHITKQSLDL